MTFSSVLPPRGPGDALNDHQHWLNGTPKLCFFRNIPTHQDMLLDLSCHCSFLTDQATATLGISMSSILDSCRVDECVTSTSSLLKRWFSLSLLLWSIEGIRFCYLINSSCSGSWCVSSRRVPMPKVLEELNVNCFVIANNVSTQWVWKTYKLYQVTSN